MIYGNLKNFALCQIFFLCAVELVFLEKMPTFVWIKSTGI